MEESKKKKKKLKVIPHFAWENGRRSLNISLKEFNQEHGFSALQRLTWTHLVPTAYNRMLCGTCLWVGTAYRTKFMIHMLTHPWFKFLKHIPEHLQENGGISSASDTSSESIERVPTLDQIRWRDLFGLSSGLWQFHNHYLEFRLIQFNPWFSPDNLPLSFLISMSVLTKFVVTPARKLADEGNHRGMTTQCLSLITTQTTTQN